MNDTLVLSCIKHIESLDEDALVNMADKLLEVPGVIIQLRATKGASHRHAVALNSAAADVEFLAASLRYGGPNYYVGRYAWMDTSDAGETLRAALYLYAIHYPGLVSGIVNAD